MKFTRRSAPTTPARARRAASRPVAVQEQLESRTLFAITFTDDFNDNNDAGWTHYDPIAEAGFPPAVYQVTYEVANGRYRIATPPTPDTAAGPGRAGSLRPEVYTDFLVSVDLVDWDNTVDQAFGILARITEPGLGTTKGYALSYATNPGDAFGDLDISLVTNEAPDDLDPSVDVRLDPAKDYRLEFEGRGAELVGRLYDLTNLAVPIATTAARDSTYTGGTAGVFVFDNTNLATTPAAPTNATFDNFAAGTPDPRSTIAYWRFEEGAPDQDFPAPPDNNGGPGSGLAIDQAGYEDHLRTFADTTNPIYRANVPAPVVTATGQPNTRSLDFTRRDDPFGGDDLYTARAGILNAHEFPQFTVEASFLADRITWMNIVGKDGNVPPLSVAPLQLKIRDDVGSSRVDLQACKLEYSIVSPK